MPIKRKNTPRKEPRKIMLKEKQMFAEKFWSDISIIPAQHYGKNRYLLNLHESGLKIEIYSETEIDFFLLSDTLCVNKVRFPPRSLQLCLSQLDFCRFLLYLEEFHIMFYCLTG